MYVYYLSAVVVSGGYLFYLFISKELKNSIIEHIFCAVFVKQSAKLDDI